MNEQQLPLLAADLIEQLNKQYPHKCPQKKDAERDIWMYAGKRELIDNLVMRLNRQQQDLLGVPVHVYE